jgi:hypothetical protein
MKMRTMVFANRDEHCDYNASPRRAAQHSDMLALILRVRQQHIDKYTARIRLYASFRDTLRFQHTKLSPNLFISLLSHSLLI